ncbi:MAG: sugar ABC transporter permease [Acholeplasmataceae bacterium]|nr:sugar ABC transporter permease [Acholeplasmataceae bacterium]
MAEKKKKKKLTKEDNKIAYLLLSPWLIGSVIFVLYPIVSIIYMTFNNVYSDVRGWNYDLVGLNNYVYAFTNPLFYQAALSFITVVLTYLPVILIASLLIARLLITDIKGKSFFRVVFFLPVLILSDSIMGMLNESEVTGSLLMDGSENFILVMINSYSPFISELLSRIFSNLISILWFTGIPIILFINALQKIDTSTYEAAKVDGATPWQTLWKITLPSMKSTAIVISVFSLVQLGTFRLNPLYELLESPLSGGVNNVGLSATYAFTYSLIIFVFIGLIAFILREKKEKTDNVYRHSMAVTRQKEDVEND